MLTTFCVFLSFSGLKSIVPNTYVRACIGKDFGHLLQAALWDLCDEFYLPMPVRLKPTTFVRQ